MRIHIKYQDGEGCITEREISDQQKETMKGRLGKPPRLGRDSWYSTAPDSVAPHRP